MFLKNFYALSLIAVLGLFSSISFAQEAPKAKANITTKQLQKFASVNKELQKKQKEMQGKMVKIIQGEDITIEKYNEIAKNQQMKGKKKFSDEDMKKFKSAGVELQKAQGRFKGELEKVIKAKGLKLAKYRYIMQAMRSDKDLQKKYRKIIQ